MTFDFCRFAGEGNSAGSNPAISNASLYLMAQIVFKDAVYPICELLEEDLVEKSASDLTTKINNPETADSALRSKVQVSCQAQFTP